MRSERCPRCRAPLPSGAAFCPSCGQTTDTLALESVEVEGTDGRTVELGATDGRRWITPAVIGVAMVGLIAALAATGGDDPVAAPDTTLEAEEATTTTRRTRPTTSSTSSTVPRPTTTSPAVVELGPLADIPTGLRVAVLGGGELREVDVDTGRSTVVVRGVASGDRLVRIDGGYAIQVGGEVDLYTVGDDPQRFDLDDVVVDLAGEPLRFSQGVQLLGQSEGAAVVLVYGDRGPHALVQVGVTGSVTGVVSINRFAWPVVAVPGGVVMSTGSGVYLLELSTGTYRRIAPGTYSSSWPGGVTTINCDDALVCSTESYTLAGELVTSRLTIEEPDDGMYFIESSAPDLRFVGDDEGGVRVVFADGSERADVILGQMSGPLTWSPSGFWLVLPSPDGLVAWRRDLAEPIRLRGLGREVSAVAVLAG